MKRAMQPAKILVVDEDKEIRKLVDQSLSEMGHRIQLARSSDEGLKRFSEDLFDVVICEVNLSGMNGIEMIQNLRASDPTVIPIVLTSKGDRDTAVRALEAGARSFLMKPFSEEDLRLRIEKALRERKRIVDSRLLLGDLIQSRSDLREKVVERERYLRQLIDAAPFGILSTDRDGNILTFNGVAEQMYGYSVGEILKHPASQLFGEDNVAGRKVDLDKSPKESKNSHIRKDGKTFPVLMRRRDILNEKQKCIAHLYVVEDLSEHEQMERQLLHAERLSLLGQLAPRIAHEFKTPLQAISGSTELALEFLEKGDVEQPTVWLEHIQPAVNQMLDLIHQLLNLGKPVESKEVELDLGDEMNKVLDMLKPLGVVKYCRIDTDFQTPLPKIIGDSVQIEQVLRNLIVNAVQAMESEPTQVLTLGLKASSDGKWVEVRVGDAGPGIPEDHLDRVFQPFFTTKTEGKGTGLGLAIVKTIVDRHGAEIQVESKVGEGTRFEVSFPVKED